MELKEYQQKALDQLKQYLELLVEWKKKADENPDLEIDFSLKAWEKAEIEKTFHSSKDGLQRYLPNFCLKIPTGGGKTLLAVKSIDLINTIYLRKRTGLILWVVPTNQIYRQTIQSLRNREHPYRQHLDIASSGRTLILEKIDRFSPSDIEENLVVLMLMLPSASRQNKETLRVFRDNGGFQSFFPPEDDIEGHETLLNKYKNLDTFGNESDFWGRQVKTSLGNTLRLLSPIIILDEGHKAYSQTAQETLHGFNPALILELSATPSEGSNILVDIRGRELDQEEMIKLDLHVINKVNPDWKNTLLASVEKRNNLEKKALDYEANTGKYIRPICLIQVERTGKEQRGSRFIHSEDVREHLINIVGIAPEQVAVTSAELKEIEGVDLQNRDCPIRYIITKQALQEGWDCAFAYVLTVLTNPSSQNALTQLVGRILRQPFAKKTKINDLDESYVFTFRQEAANVLANIKKGFEDEGLGDLAGQVIAEDEAEEGQQIVEKVYSVRESFKEAVKQIILPIFLINDNGNWRKVSYETDIVSRINWNEVNIKSFFPITLSPIEAENIEVAVGLAKDEDALIRNKVILREKEGGLTLDPVFISRHLLDIVPNPWIAYDLGSLIINELLKNNEKYLVISNLVYIIEELRKYLEKEKDRLAREVFQTLLEKDILRFMVIGKNLGFRFPLELKQKPTSRKLHRNDGEPLQRSLFEYIPEESVNEEEKKVAWYLEDQDKLFFWYRNIPCCDYAIQGWRRQKIYPDFIFTSKDENEALKKVFVVETKGVHLKNEDTDYKKEMFDICNESAEQKNFGDLKLVLKDVDIKFEVVFGDEWKRRLNEMLESQ